MASGNDADAFNKFLIESGLSKYYKDEEDNDVSLYHDLNIYGDIAESYIELLAEKYGVDVSAFDFGSYFPPEFTGESTLQRYLYSFVPFLASLHNAKKTYKRFTFGVIKQTLRDRALR